jgi:hypothetical protein
MCIFSGDQHNCVDMVVAYMWLLRGQDSLITSQPAGEAG